MAEPPALSDATYSSPEGMPAGLTATAENDRAGKSVAWAGVFLLVALTLVAWRNVEMLNPDAIAYLRLAFYYAHGQFDLAIAGYWGPLLSWLLAPLLKLGMQPLIAARVVMAVSAVIFWLSCVVLFRSFRLPVATHALGAWLAALAAVGWSVRFITPDLLASGLICLAVSQTIQLRWLESRTCPMLVGFLWGLAYLAKAVALPLALVVTLCVTALEWSLHRAGTRNLLRSCSVTLLTCALIASPWVLILSLKYGNPTFSTTVRIAHAVAGPPDVNRQHPFAIQFHRPEPGRITSWEDPSHMPYMSWSPIESSAYALHQLKVMAKNVFTIASMMTRMDLLLPVLLLFLACALARRHERLGLIQQRWFLALIPVVALAVLYLPFFLNPEDQRYFYAVFPFLWVTSVGVLDWLETRFGNRSAWLKRVGVPLLFAAFALPALLLLGASIVGLPRFAPACKTAHQLATKLDAAGMAGPIAGSALMRGGRAGLYTAFFLNQPWNGDEAQPTASSFKKSGARLVIVKRDDPVVTQLESDAAYSSLDNRLFGSASEAAKFPLKVYELLSR